MEPLSTKEALEQSSENQTYEQRMRALASVKKAPQKWLCRLGPFQTEFNPGHEMELAQWAQNKTKYYAVWDYDTQVYFARKFSEAVKMDKPYDEIQFGYTMRLDPLPLNRTPTKLPVFYPGPPFGVSWKGFEVAPVVETPTGYFMECAAPTSFTHWGVYLKLSTGGHHLAAVVSAKEQAEACGETFMLIAQSFSKP